MYICYPVLENKTVQKKDVERSQLYNIVLDDVKAGMMSNPVTQ
jgi:hypothetical protein